MSDLGVMFGMMYGSFLLVLLVALVYGVFSAIAHYSLFKLYAYANWWLMFVPVGFQYALTDIVIEDDEQITVFGQSISGKTFKLWGALSLAVSFIPAVGSIASFVISVICLKECYQRIYAGCENETYEAMSSLALVSAIIQPVAVVKFFNYRKLLK